MLGSQLFYWWFCAAIATRAADVNSYCGNMICNVVLHFCHLYNFLILICQGNTAVYLEYAHARICSIVKKSNKDISTLQQVTCILLNYYFLSYFLLCLKFVLGSCLCQLVLLCITYLKTSLLSMYNVTNVSTSFTDWNDNTGPS